MDCSIEGCGKTATVRGWCPMHYQRWRHHGSTDDPRLSAEDRFWAKVDRSGDCWLWTGALAQGYGSFHYQGRSIGAHCFAYGLEREIPKGFQLDHRPTCPKNCVTPEHLRLVTQKQNNENLPGARSHSKTGVRGVFWSEDRQKYRVEARHNGVSHSGGYFDDLNEAAVAAIVLRNRLFTHNDLDREVS